MPIGPFTMIALYVVCWWTVLFIVLPLGMNQQGQERPADGGQWGAPANPMLKRKFLTTTWVSLLVWGVIILIVWSGMMPLPNLPSPVA
jgi:predicted secreted protein